jgi:hypothetical protein
MIGFTTLFLPVTVHGVWQFVRNQNPDGSVCEGQSRSLTSGNMFGMYRAASAGSWSLLSTSAIRSRAALAVSGLVSAVVAGTSAGRGDGGAEVMGPRPVGLLAASLTPRLSEGAAGNTPGASRRSAVAECGRRLLSDLAAGHFGATSTSSCHDARAPPSSPYGAACGKLRHAHADCHPLAACQPPSAGGPRPYAVGATDARPNVRAAFTAHSSNAPRSPPRIF